MADEKIIKLDQLSKFKELILQETNSAVTDSLVERLIDNASYNILPNLAQDTEEGTSGGSGGSIDWRVNADGSITLVKNTYTSVNKYLVINSAFEMYEGKYTMFGCAKGGSASTYWIEITVNNQTYKDYGHGVKFTLDDTYTAQIRIVMATEAKNLTFYPMIVRGEKDLLTYTEPQFGDIDTENLIIDNIKQQDGYGYYFEALDITTGEIVKIREEQLDSDPANQQSAIKEQNLYTNYYPTNVQLAEMIDELGTVDVATTSTVGTVKPDGTTITIDQDGTIHGSSQTPIATTSTVGTVKPDDVTIGIDSNGTISVNKATASALGVVKPDGTSITIDNDGTIHGASQTPIATSSTVGTVKPDNTTIAVDSNGAISVNKATSSDIGAVKPDNTTITVDSNGTLTAATASASAIGMVKPDGTTITIDSNGTIHGSSQVDIATTSDVGTVKPDGTTITITSAGVISVNFASYSQSELDNMWQNAGGSTNGGNNNQETYYGYDNLRVGETYMFGGNAYSTNTSQYGSIVANIGTGYANGTYGVGKLLAIPIAINNNDVIMVAFPICTMAWPGTSELSSSLSTYFGECASAISNIYLPKLKDNFNTTNKASLSESDMYLYYNNWTNTYSSSLKTNYYNIVISLATVSYVNGNNVTIPVWLGTRYIANGVTSDIGSRTYSLSYSGPTNVEDYYYSENNSSSLYIMPTFVLNKTKVSVEHSIITYTG